MSSPKEIDLKCLVCEEVKEAFICVKCICSGDYTKSTMFCGHRCTADTAVAYDAKDATIIKWTMKDRKTFFRLLEVEKTKMSKRFEELLAEYKKLEEIESHIAEYEFKISNMKNLIKLRKSEAILAEERSLSMVKNEERLQTRIESSADISKDLNKIIDHSKSRVASHYAESNKIEAEIKKKNRENLLKLREQLFPFDSIDDPTKSCVKETFSNQNTHKSASIDSKADITQPSVSKQNHRHYCIVESWIPRDSGAFEYSEFLSLCKQRVKLINDFKMKLEDDDDDDFSTRDNDAYRISAALANISQLISVASSILDIRLPKKQKFFDWYTTWDVEGIEIFPSDCEIFHKAAKLNANLIYLCLSQNVQTKLLRPIMTGRNLSLIFDPDNSNLGRTGPILIPQDLHRAVEDSLLSDFNMFDAGDYEDFEFFDEELGDWEAVSRSSVVDISQDNQTTITSESILTNLAETCYNAVTSFIRG